MIAVAAGPQPDAAAGGGVFGGIVQQVGDRLRQPGQVAIELDLVGRQLQHQPVMAGFDPRPAGFDRALDHRPQRDPLFLQPDLAAADARDVQQVVDQPDHVHQLTLDDGARPLRRRAVAGVLLENLQAGADRRQRVAQLVRQGGEEFVLGTAGLEQGLLGRLALGDVDHRPRHPVRLAALVLDGDAGDADPAPLAGAGAKPAFELVFAAIAQVAAQVAAQALEVVRVQHLADRIRPVRKLRRRVAEHFAQPRRKHHRVGQHVPVPQAGTGAAHRELVALVACEQRQVGLLQGPRALSQFVQHVVEGIGQRADFVVGQARRAQVEVAAAHHPRRHVADRQDRAGQARLQPVGQQQRRRQAGEEDCRQRAQVLQHAPQQIVARLQKHGADDVAVGDDRTRDRDPVAIELDADSGRLDRRRTAVGIARRESGEQLALRGVDRRRDNCGAGPQHGEVLARDPGVVECQRRRAGQRHDVGLGHQVALERGDLVAHVEHNHRRPRHQQGEEGGRHHDHVELALDRSGVGKHFHRCRPSTACATSSRRALNRSPRASAEAREAANRTRGPSATKLMTLP